MPASAVSRGHEQRSPPPAGPEYLRSLPNLFGLTFPIYKSQDRMGLAELLGLSPIQLPTLALVSRQRRRQRFLFSPERQKVLVRIMVGCQEKIVRNDFFLSVVSTFRSANAR